jgi:hypothetical protein
MRWSKRGLLLPPPAVASWTASHAALPIAGTLEGERRLLFSSRDQQGRARIGQAQLAVGADGLSIGRIDPEPLLDLGPLGAYDDSGVTGSCLVSHEGRQYLYFTGWSLGRSVPFYLAIGLAVSDDGGRSFTRVSAAPIVGRSAADPFLTASPWVLVEQGRWRMWYVSATHWEGERHYYHVRYAESDDGIRWEATGRVAVDFAGPGEYAISRPCVVRDGDRYRMWYSYRGDRYTLGYAESDDGLTWGRRDAEAGLATSVDGWDAEMIAYPAVFEAEGTQFMLYNGTGYGQTGIGYAVREED